MPFCVRLDRMGSNVACTRRKTSLPSSCVQSISIYAILPLRCMPLVSERLAYKVQLEPMERLLVMDWNQITGPI